MRTTNRCILLFLFYTFTIAGCGDGVDDALSSNIAQPERDKPSTQITPKKSEHNTPFEVTLSCADGTGSGCAKTWYCTGICSDPIETGSVFEWPASELELTLTIMITNSLTLKYRSIDNAGNKEDIKFKDYIVENSAPVTTANVLEGPGPYTNSIKVQLSCSDFPVAGAAGCDKIVYIVGNGLQIIYTPTEAAPLVTLDINTSTTLYFHSIDNAGNKEAQQSQLYTIDVASPTYSVNPASGTTIYTQTPIIFTFTENMDSTSNVSYTGSMGSQISGAYWSGSSPDGTDILTLRPMSSWQQGIDQSLIVTAADLAGNRVTSSQLTYAVLKIERLNDTGIVLCGDSPPDIIDLSTQNNDVDCAASGATATETGIETDNGLSPVPAGQDAHFGRDVTNNNDSDGHAGFSFSKLDNNGKPLFDQSVAYENTPWSCVQDQVTGLMWEVKSNDSGLRHKDWTYSWYNSSGVNNGGDTGAASGGRCADTTNASCDTEKFIAAVNAASLCGYSDWRLPSLGELFSIMDHSVETTTAPGIDIRWFPNPVFATYGSPSSKYYWSSVSFAERPFNAWVVEFGRYNSYNRVYKGDAYYIRLVRAQ